MTGETELTPQLQPHILAAPPQHGAGHVTSELTVSNMANSSWDFLSPVMARSLPSNTELSLPQTSKRLIFVL